MSLWTSLICGKCGRKLIIVGNCDILTKVSEGQQKGICFYYSSKRVSCLSGFLESTGKQTIDMLIWKRKFAMFGIKTCCITDGKIVSRLQERYPVQQISNG